MWTKNQNIDYGLHILKCNWSQLLWFFIIYLVFEVGRHVGPVGRVGPIILAHCACVPYTSSSPISTISITHNILAAYNWYCLQLFHCLPFFAATKPRAPAPAKAPARLGNMALAITEVKKGNRKKGGTWKQAELEEEDQRSTELEMQIQGKMERAQKKNMIWGGASGPEEVEEEEEERKEGEIEDSIEQEVEQ